MSNRWSNQPRPATSGRHDPTPEQALAFLRRGAPWLLAEVLSLPGYFRQRHRPQLGLVQQLTGRNL